MLGFQTRNLTQAGSHASLRDPLLRVPGSGGRTQAWTSGPAASVAGP